jgi:hypothetical protein
MVYTVPVAEALGGIVGIAVGRLCAKYGRQLASSNGVPEVVGAVAGSVIGHYLSGTVTKVCVNAMGLDVAGAAFSAGVSTPIIALGHGLFEGLTVAVTDLGLGELIGANDLTQIVADTLSSADVQPHLQQLTSLLDNPSDSATAAVHHAAQHFSGSSQPLEVIADMQVGPTCGLESIENLIQAKLDWVGNNFSDFVIQQGWYNPATGGLRYDMYQQIMAHFGVNSQWVDVGSGSVWNAVCGSDTGALVVGDPTFLDAHYSHWPPHAITLHKPWHDQYGQPVGYEGIDPNFEGRSFFWTFEQLRQFNAAGPLAGAALITL